MLHPILRGATAGLMGTIVQTTIGATESALILPDHEDANIARAVVYVLEESGFPHRVILQTATGDTMLFIELGQVEFDTGLSAEDLLWYPPDAELIDER